MKLFPAGKILEVEVLPQTLERLLRRNLMR